LTVYACVILENHLHLIASADDLSKEIANFRSYTVRQIIDTFKAKNAQHILKQLNTYKLHHKTDRDYQLWQEGTHPQLIQGEVMMRQKIEYIHDNPVKRGYVDDPTHWRYSSARSYGGQKGLLEVQTDW
jgi:REP element-mobilizing transposase RayT